MTYRYRTARGPDLTPLWIIIGLNILLFAVTEITYRINPDVYNEILLQLGLKPAIFLAKPWTVVTSLFLHSGLWHILANMITLYFFGRYLYLLVGKWRFLLVYFTGGIVGGIFFVLITKLQGIEDVSAIGASGAVFALGSVLAVLQPQLKVIVFPIPAPIPLWIAVIGGFIIITALTLFTPLFSNVAWQAHLGGLALGLAAGYYFRKRLRRVY